MVFKYHLIRSKENPDFIYVFDESKTKLLATINEGKETESGFGEFILITENIILDIGYIVKRARSKFAIETTKEQRQSHCDQLIKMKVDLGDALRIEDILWSYEDEYRKQ